VIARKARKKMVKKFMKGNVAIAKAAIKAGLKFFGGYPITPASEILECIAMELPKMGGTFRQAASEIAAINMVYGAAAAGARAMTASSSPGMSLKMECISYMALARIPCVIVDIMRGGPGLGDIQPAQSDYFQIVKGGGHGDYHLIVLAPSTVQEAADLTMLAFDLADKYRNPVVVLGDGALGQMMEAVEFKDYIPLKIEKPWALTGAKGRSPNRITPFNLSEVELEKMNIALWDSYGAIKKREVLYEKIGMDLSNPPEVIIVAFGMCGRIAKTVRKMAAEAGINIGLIRPITLWPFPGDAIRNYANIFSSAKILTVEMNMGQMIEDVKLAIGNRQVDFYGRTGGVVPSPEEILEKIKIMKGV
jgi:2-oxoglutarate/2-oxoacid ferredoxin oxidoreductase subunit alpha